MPFTFLYITLESPSVHSPYHKLLAFQSCMQAWKWREDMNKIKHDIALKNQVKESGLRDGVLYEQDMREWLGFVDSMVDIWGLGLIPLDIRNGVHSVQLQLELPSTVFGVDYGGYSPPNYVPAYDVTIEE